MRTPTTHEVALRPVGPDDGEFLYRVYASTRREELTRTGWSEEQKTSFLRMQFDAQSSYYREHYAGAELSVILADGRPAGRLYVARWPREIRLIDVSLLPMFRGRGKGTRLLEALISESEASEKPLSIHVERFNPALGLYERLGFEQKEDNGVYLLMERRTAAQHRAS